MLCVSLTCKRQPKEFNKHRNVVETIVEDFKLRQVFALHLPYIYCFLVDTIKT